MDVRRRLAEALLGENFTYSAGGIYGKNKEGQEEK